MTVYKATRGDLTCRMGSGVFRYEIGVPARADNSKCGSTGLHACEYVLDCLNYYPLADGNRFFRAEAAGDIAEDGADTRIACTELTLWEELTIWDIARAAMRFMLDHPRRDGWQKRMRNVLAAEDAAEMKEPFGIAIARGRDPMVKGIRGSVLGLIREDESGRITEAKLLIVQDPVSPDEWHTLESLRELAEKRERSKADEEKADFENCAGETQKIQKGGDIRHRTV